MGGKKDIKVDVRIVVASNVNFPNTLKAGKFRSDLFYRLNEFPIVLPPLRERKADILSLANRFLEDAKKEFNKDIKGFSPDAMKTLFDCEWPGNVRELKNKVRRAVLLTDSDKITRESLALDVITEPHQDVDNLSENIDIMSELDKGVSLHELAHKKMDDIEKCIIRQTLILTGGNKSKAAKMLKTDRMTLYTRLKKHGIEQ